MKQIVRVSLTSILVFLAATCLSITDSYAADESDLIVTDTLISEESASEDGEMITPPSKSSSDDSNSEDSDCLSTEDLESEGPVNNDVSDNTIIISSNDIPDSPDDTESDITDDLMSEALNADGDIIVDGTTVSKTFTKSGERDTHYFEMDSTGIIQIDLNSDKSLKMVTLNIFVIKDDNNTIVERAYTIGTLEKYGASVTKTIGLLKGRYCFELRGDNTSGTVDYTVTLIKDKDKYQTEEEGYDLTTGIRQNDNGKKEKASPITLDEETLTYHGLLTRNNSTDYYKLDIAEGAVVISFYGKSYNDEDRNKDTALLYIDSAPINEITYFENEKVYTSKTITEGTHILSVAKTPIASAFSYSFTINRQYSLTYDGNEADSGDPPKKDYSFPGREVSLPDRNTLEKAGYKFLGWSKTKDGSSPFKPGESFTMEANNVTMYAVWDKPKHVLYKTKRDNDNGDYIDGEAPSDPKDYYNGDSITIIENTTLTRAGYKLLGWTDGQDGTSPKKTLSMGEKDITLYPVWYPKIHDISYSFENPYQTVKSLLCNYVCGTKKDKYGPNKKEATFGNYIYASLTVSGNKNRHTCFGVATTAGMLYGSNNGVNITDFNENAQSTWNLSQTDVHSKWKYTAFGFIPIGLTLDDFIQCMFITQATSAYDNSQIYVQFDNVGKSKFFNKIKAEIGDGKLVAININGNNHNPNYRNEPVNHTLLAYDVYETSDRKEIFVYDPNYQTYPGGPYELKKIILSASPVEIRLDDLADPGTRHVFNHAIFWNSSDLNSTMSYMTYDAYLNLWNNRGSLYDDSKVLVSSGNGNINIYGSNGGVNIVNGELTENTVGASKVTISSLSPQGNTDEYPLMLYLPKGSYIIENTDSKKDELDLSFVNIDYGGTIKTKAKQVSFIADDEKKICEFEFIDGTDAPYEIVLETSAYDENLGITIKGDHADAGGSAQIQDNKYSKTNLDDSEIETKGDIEKAESFSITFDSQGGTTVDKIDNIEINSTINLPTTTKDGFLFGGWYTAPNGQGERYTDQTPITKSLTLYAFWKEKGHSDPSDDETGDVLSGDIPADGKIPEGIWVAGMRNLTYDGTKQTQEIRVYDNTKLLVEKTDYTVSYKNNLNAYHIANPTYMSPDTKKSAPQLILNMKGNYSGKQTVYFSIEPLSIEDPESFTAYFKKKGDKNTPVLMWNGKALKNHKDYSLITEETRVTFIGNNNFTGGYSIFTNYPPDIPVQIPMSKVKVSAIPVQTYTGAAYTVADLKAKDGKTPFKIEVKYGATELKENEDYYISRIMNATKIGTATIVLKGLNYTGENRNSYVGEKRINFKISGYPMTGSDIAVTDKDGGRTLTAEYNKSGAKPEFKVTFAGVTLKKGRDYTVKYSSNTKYPSSNAYVTITGKGNFTNKIKVPFSITQRPFTESAGITVVAADKTVGSKANQYQTTIKVFDSEGKQLKAGTDYQKTFTYYSKGELLTASSFPKAGDIVTVNVTGLGGYRNDSIEAEYKILNKGEVTDISKATIKIKNQVYNKGDSIEIISQDQISQAFIGKAKTSISLSVDDGSTGQFIVIPGSYTKNMSKGTASVSFRGINGYSGVKTVKYKIGSRSLINYWLGWIYK